MVHYTFFFPSLFSNIHFFFFFYIHPHTRTLTACKNIHLKIPLKESRDSGRKLCSQIFIRSNMILILYDREDLSWWKQQIFHYCINSSNMLLSPMLVLLFVYYHLMYRCLSIFRNLTAYSPLLPCIKRNIMIINISPT